MLCQAADSVKEFLIGKLQSVFRRRLLGGPIWMWAPVAFPLTELRNA